MPLYQRQKVDNGPIPIMPREILDWHSLVYTSAAEPEARGTRKVLRDVVYSARDSCKLGPQCSRTPVKSTIWLNASELSQTKAAKHNMFSGTWASANLNWCRSGHDHAAQPYKPRSRSRECGTLRPLAPMLEQDLH